MSSIKKTKKKGIIRFEALIPSSLIIGLCWLYFALFFDSHLKRGMEWVGSQIHGAEVNISSVQTSFTKAFLRINDIQVTDSKQNTRNVVQIEKIYFKFLWDALLRAKFVTDDAEIKNIQLYAPRKSPGKIYPKNESHLVKNIENNLKNQIDEKTSNNVIGDIARLLDGAQPKDQIKVIQENLKSDQRIKELEKILKEKEVEWKQRLESLPKKEKLAQLKQRAKAIEKTNTKNPLAIAQGLKDLKGLIKETDSIYNNYEKTSRSLKTEIKALNSSVKELEKFAEQDLKDLQARMSIPSLDAQSITQSLFAGSFSNELAQIKKYMNLGRQYMPAKTTPKEEEQIVPRKRQEGRNFKFPITTGYPKFWLKRARISSEPTDSPYSGRLAGEIRNVTDNPRHIKDPATLSINGDFPKMKFFGVNALITIDHRTEEAVEKFEASIASYPLSNFTLADDKNIKVNLKQALGKLDLTGQLKNQTLNVNINNIFKDNQFEVKSPSQKAQSVLGRVFNNLPALDIQSRATGSWDKLSWHIRSNLGKELEGALKGELKAQIAQEKKKLKALIDNKISKQKQQLIARIDKSTGGVASQLSNKSANINDLKKDLKRQLKSKKSDKKKKLEKKAKDALKKLFK